MQSCVASFRTLVNKTEIDLLSRLCDDFEFFHLYENSQILLNHNYASMPYSRKIFTKNSTFPPNSTKLWWGMVVIATITCSYFMKKMKCIHFTLYNVFTVCWVYMFPHIAGWVWFTTNHFHTILIVVGEIIVANVNSASGWCPS